MNEIPEPNAMPDAGDAMNDAAAEIEALKAQLADAEQREAAAKDTQLRALAELDNARRRVERELANGLRYASEKILGELLLVCDSLELGLKAAEGADAQVKALTDGMQLTYRQLMALLEKNGVRPVDPTGEPFNPDAHQAMTMAATAEVPPNHVLSVMQKGYRLHDRLLRPAMVVVAKAP